MLRRLTLILTLIGMVGLLTAPAVSAARPAQPAATDLNALPITGDLGDGTFEGLVDITSFELVDGTLTATGTVTGDVLDAAGNVIGSIVDVPFTTTADLTNPGGGKCDILELNLGPIDLDLLGLVVNLSAIDLNVDAVPGAGNLLGNLLCAVAGLLDGPGGGLGNALNNLLGRINDLLSGLLG